MMLLTTEFDSIVPVAGWLSKMIVPLPFGRSCWSSKFFVLLGSELRYYKDEHTETASQILDLHQISQVTCVSTINHPFCFRLEPKENQIIKPWIIECKTEQDMNTWVLTIQHRIRRAYSSAVKMDDMLQISKRWPLCCCTVSSSNKKSLLARRNKKLTPIITMESIQYLPPPPPSSSSPCMSSTTNSSSKSILSSSSTVVDFSSVISPGIIERYYPYHQTKSYQEEDAISLEESSSPTYLNYKKRFHL
ncbi:uncharacterized protein BX663DRAFT_560326 [Cokeromyces recurvatus]|uniref:uncharacterized protein n=1 Tax=Cokeromyces recurvatus TaxID=90255 RepID=UPI00221FEB58|nr:uncharacterized protein BX663DRAFT_560326 [Cokeromyces recurvatus]KAI7903986.1 hypothetical protein BX663DRAFT_560326 [Cokeromyces recurvatus]